ncbi:MAG: hypothetical protein QOI77_2556 [Blastocatellia bacterium]|jgi:hypothetical protein|nr:hypothetical protein [Blastocatellia bacterium]
MRPSKKLPATFLILVLIPSLLVAQKNLSDWSNVEKLKPGTRVIVTTRKGREFIGEKRQTTDDTLFMEIGLPGSGTRVISVPREEIGEVRKGKSRWVYPLLGAAIGVAAGVAIGSTADHPGSDDPGLGKLLGGGLGGLIGGGTGSVIAKTKRWKKIYSAP